MNWIKTLSLISVLYAAQNAAVHTWIGNDTVAFKPLEVNMKQAGKKGDTVTVIGVGDIMLGTNFPDESYLPPAAQENLLLPVKAELQNATLTFGNLEGTILNEGGKVKQCKDPKACYAFRMPERLTGYLKDAGFDVMSLANNHSGDFGAEGRANAMRVLDSLDIKSCGLEVRPTTIVERDGVKFGIAGFAPNSGTISINDIEKAKEYVKDLKDKCDIVIVSFHGGAEGRAHQHVTQNTEMFYGENRGNVYLFAHAMVDAGADIIFGHGPHVPRALDLYKGRMIAYSLGNFCTYGRFSLKGEAGFAPLLKVYTDRQGNFIKARLLSYQQLGEGGPTPDPKKNALQRIAALTKEDISGCGLNFSEDGWISCGGRK